AVWHSRGMAHRRLGQLDKAIADYGKAIQLDSKDPKIWNNRASAYFDLHQYEKSIADCSEALKLDSELPDPRCIRGQAYWKLGQWDKAIADYDKAVKLGPGRAEIANDLAWFLATCPDAKVRDPGRAVQVAEKAVALAPTSGRIWSTLGVARHRAGDWK